MVSFYHSKLVINYVQKSISGPIHVSESGWVGGGGRHNIRLEDVRCDEEELALVLIGGVITTQDRFFDVENYYGRQVIMWS
jgi:hypothetical protein